MPAYQNSRNGRGRRDAPKKERAPERVMPGPTILANGKKDWSAYNACVVGASWDLRAPLHPASPPGLQEATERGLAAEAVWMATRKTYTYANDEDGWVRVRRAGRGRRRRLMMQEDEE